jgi:hypothetical protein
MSKASEKTIDLFSQKNNTRKTGQCQGRGGRKETGLFVDKEVIEDLLALSYIKVKNNCELSMFRCD